MKIIDKLNEHLRSNTPASPFFSFEFFPPKTEAGTENLYLRMERMTALQPLFVDVTWGAGGSTKELTMAISQYSQMYFGVEVLMHLTCTNLAVEELKRILNSARAAGIQNILALRGDPPKGAIKWKKVPGGLDKAIDLVRLIRQEHGDYFCIAVAGFPEGHPANAPPLLLSPQKEKMKHKTAVGDELNSSDGDSTSSGGDKSTRRAAGTLMQGACSSEDIQHLKEKIDAGADFVLTQFFYDPLVFLRYLEQCRSSGVKCPIIPGIMPIQGYNSFDKMTTFCRTAVPEQVKKDLLHFTEDDESVKNYGVQLCVKICRVLQAAGVPGFHFYTLNLEKSAMLILDALNVKDSTATRRALPWRGSRTGGGQKSSHGNLTSLTNSNSNISSNNSSTAQLAGSSSGNLAHSGSVSISSGSGSGCISQGAGQGMGASSPPNMSQNMSQISLCSGMSDKDRSRCQEDVRPINWANRPKSYIKRTVTWDEFPNGRWGDGRSPAFGELSDSHFFRPSEGSKEDRLAMWGEAPTELSDVYEVFAKFVEGKIPILPWCETPTQAETHIISAPLAAFNRAGFLTINSQPAVNGEKSDHPVFGWGGAGGRVYQKAYIEFFTSPELLQIILDVVRAKPHLNVHAVDSNHQQPLYAGLKGVTALTWGVFPNKEILQPTVFDPDTFVVWSEEAFQLWTSAWAELYDDDTESSELLYNIHDTYYLVAIIDHEYLESDLYSVFTDAIVEQTRRRALRGGGGGGGGGGDLSSDEVAVDIDS